MITTITTPSRRSACDAGRRRRRRSDDRALPPPPGGRRARAAPRRLSPSARRVELARALRQPLDAPPGFSLRIRCAQPKGIGTPRSLSVRKRSWIGRKSPSRGRDRLLLADVTDHDVRVRGAPAVAPPSCARSAGANSITASRCELVEAAVVEADARGRPAGHRRAAVRSPGRRERRQVAGGLIRSQPGRDPLAVRPSGAVLPSTRAWPNQLRSRPSCGDPAAAEACWIRWLAAATALLPTS